MDYMTIDELKEHIESALKWASDMSEGWTNTLYGNMIDRERSILENATKAEEWSKAHESMIELVHMCHQAENELALN